MVRIWYPWSYLYLAVLLGLLLAFKLHPLLIELSPGVMFTPWTIVTGLIFVLRDFSQREIGHWVWIPMLVGVFLSFFMSPEYGLAIIISSLAGEAADWAVYSYTKKPFHQRVVLSSFASAPVDTLSFFLAFDLLQVIPGVSIFNWATVVIGILSKLVAGVFIWYLYQKQIVQPLDKP